MALISNLKSKISHFIRDDAGAYAMIFAVSAPTLFGSISIAMETTSAMSQQEQSAKRP